MFKDISTEHTHTIQRNVYASVIHLKKRARQWNFVNFPCCRVYSY